MFTANFINSENCSWLTFSTEVSFPVLEGNSQKKVRITLVSSGRCIPFKDHKLYHF